MSSQFPLASLDKLSALSIQLLMHMQRLADLEFIAFDTETSGAYPVGGEILEFAGVRFRLDKIIDEFSVLIKPLREIDPITIGIHGITAESLANEPTMKAILPEIHKFINGAHMVAHHAPFDMGFLAWDFEQQQLPAPKTEGICTSLLAINTLTGIENHRLASLAKHFSITQDVAHRAMADAKVCHQVFLRLLDIISQKEGTADLELQHLWKHQGKHLFWPDFSLMHSQYPWMPEMIRAVQNRSPLQISYQKNKSYSVREVLPLGIVRNPNGDYCMGVCANDQQKKRFYLAKISDAACVTR